MGYTNVVVEVRPPKLDLRYQLVVFTNAQIVSSHEKCKDFWHNVER
jgi:hypothetical protein